MNTNAKTLIKTSLLTLSMGVALLAAKAQNVQGGSVWAPANIKIDGKLTEWSNSLEANNKTVNFSYTIANDDKNLYLAVKSIDQQSTNKILAGGVDFTINTEDKKKDKDAFVLVFPVINRAANRGPGQGRQRGAGGGPPGPPDSATIAAQRAQAIASIKEIKLRGFKDIPDSVISIYNEYSIKAAVAYDTNGSLVYEISVPLSQLGLSVDKSKEIAYNLKVNGIQFNRNRDDRNGQNRNGANAGGANAGGDNSGGNNAGGNNAGGFGGNRGGGGGGARGGGGGNRGGGAPGGARGGFGGGFNMQDMMTPTDFWGKYTLAKKAQ